MLIDFIKTYSPATEKVRLLVEVGDYSEAERILHTLKGIAGNISADKMHRAVQDLETAIAGRDKSAFESLLLEMQQEMRLLTEVIKAYDESWEEEMPLNPTPAISAQVASVIGEMYQLICRNDPSALKNMEQLRENLRAPRFAEDIESLGAHLARYDFQQAKCDLRSIAIGLDISLGE